MSGSKKNLITVWPEIDWEQVTFDELEVLDGAEINLRVERRGREAWVVAVLLYPVGWCDNKISPICVELDDCLDKCPDEHVICTEKCLYR